MESENVNENGKKPKELLLLDPEDVTSYDLLELKKADYEAVVSEDLVVAWRW